MSSSPCALVISPSVEGWFLPSLLGQAGWQCDVISLVDTYCVSACIRSFCRVQASQDFADTALQLYEQGTSYDWVILTSDDLLGELAFRSRLDQRFLALLPIDSAAARSHLFSKINLSRLLDLHGLPTPLWSVASSCDEALRQAEGLGYPCFLKRDRSSGGLGTIYCQQPGDLALAASRLESHSFLLQQVIEGELWSVEALYWHEQLRSYSLSLVIDTVRSYGPSLTRRYGFEAELIPGLLPLLESLGSALSAHGWANISLLRHSVTGDIYLIEADLRPNAWVALDQRLGGDFADAIRRIQDSLLSRAAQCYVGEATAPLDISHFQRLVQIGAPSHDVQRAMLMQPDESPEFIDKLVHGKFYIPLA